MTGITLYRVEVDEYDDTYGAVNRKPVSRDAATAEMAKAWAKDMAALNPGRQFHVVRVDTECVVGRMPAGPIESYARQSLEWLDREIALGDGRGEMKMTVDSVQPEVNRTMTDRPAPGKPAPLPENYPTPPDMRYRVEWMDYAGTVGTGELGQATPKVMTFGKTEAAAHQAADSWRNTFPNETFRVAPIGGDGSAGVTFFDVRKIARGGKVKVSLTEEEAAVALLPRVFYATFVACHTPGSASASGNWAEVATTSGVLKVRPGRLSPHDGVPDLSTPAPPTPAQAAATEGAFTRCPECDGKGVHPESGMACHVCEGRKA